MGKTKKQLKSAVAGAREAADRAEKAAKRARQDRRRAESALAALTDASAGENGAVGQRETSSDPVEDLTSLTRVELLKRAREAEIAGRSGMTKAELAAALAKA